MKRHSYIPRTVMLVCLALAFAFNAGSARGQANFAGRVDASFRPPTDIGIPLYVHETYAVAIQPDGKVLFGGRMYYEGDQVIRLNVDGSRDANFSGGSPVEFTDISAITVQPDGAILLGGATLSRLLPDGTPDPSFSAEISGDSTIWKRTPTRLALQPDGKILITGHFTSVNDIPVPGIARLLPDGSVDSTFAFDAASLPTTIDAMQLQPDGKILVAGYNYTVATNTWEGRFIRLMPNGSLDPDFTTDPTRGVSTIALQNDGRIVVAGYYWNGSYQEHGFIDRYTESGSDDPTFAGDSEFNIHGWDTEGVQSLLVQPDGKIVAGGSFFLADALGSLLRLNADGTRDADFDSIFQSSGGDDIFSVTSMARQSDGRIYIAGDFASVGDVPRQGIARLFTDGYGAQGIVSFSASSYSITENGSNLSVTIQREGPDLGPVTVSYVIQNVTDYYVLYYTGIQGGQPEEDFSALTGEVDFANGETSKTFSIPVRDDALLEPTETVELAITGSSVPLAYGDRTKAFLHVFDDDTMGLPGSIIPAFSGQVSGTVSALLTQPDGRLLVGGSFTYTDGAVRTNLVRLNLDGSLDLSFAPTVADVTTLALQPDGKIIVAGSSISRLNANGSPDATFQTFTDGNAIEALAIQADGKVLAASIGGLQRLQSNGLPDPGFNAFQGMSATARVSKVRALALQPDGRILAGGVNDVTQLPVLARLNPDGTGDAGFAPPIFEMGYYGFQFGILSLVLQPDGKVLAGGGFAFRTQQTGYSSLIRLNPNGTVDPGFAPLFYSNSAVSAVLRQADGRLLVSESLGWNNPDRAGLRRLFENGADDHSLIAATQTMGLIKSIALQPNTIWIGGTFTSLNGYSQPALARLTGDSQAGPGRIEFMQSYGGVKENVGSASFKLRRYWGTNGPVSVHYETSDGTALAGTHYVATSGTVSFANGEVEKTINVSVLDNTTPDFNHNFTIALSQPTGGAQLGEFSGTWVNILENDAGVIARRAEIIGNGVYPRDNFSVRETTGFVDVEVYYVGETPANVITLNYFTRDGTAQVGKDYTARAAYTLFGGGYSLRQEIQVPILADGVPELPETFTITLSTPTPGIQIVQSELTITIVDSTPGFRLLNHPIAPTQPGRFRMLLQAPSSEPFALEASTDLIHWSVLETFPARSTLDPLEFEDVDAATFPKRFYRLAPVH